MKQEVIMVNSSILERVRPGMEVRSADGKMLGRISEVWLGSDPVSSTARCDEDVCSRLEVRREDAATYIPYNAIASVSGKIVTLAVDAATVSEKGWYRKPLWIQDETPPPGQLYHFPGG
jgi:hypothetical protein